MTQTTKDEQVEPDPSLAVYDSGAQFATIREIIEAARRRLAPEIWNYIAGGASGEETLRANRRAFRRWTFDGRMLAGINRPDLRTRTFDRDLTAPVFVSPFGHDAAIRPPGHLAVGRAVARCGITNVVPEASTDSLESIAATCDGQHGMFQLTLVGPDSHVLGLAQRAREAGYAALCFTDGPMRAWRERLRESRLDLMSSYGMGNYGPGGADVNVLRELVAFTEPRWDWSRLERIAAACPLPWVLKGVLTAFDAKRAVDAGASGIYVSNYGGRDVDGLPATLDRLQEVVDAVDGAVPVMFDGGVRHGTDVVKALAMGADLVGIGRLAALGLAADGESGVVRVIELLTAEMEAVVGGLGYDRVAQLGRECLRREPSDTSSGLEGGSDDV